MKVIIEIEAATIEPHDAIYRVARVVESGRTSKVKRKGVNVFHFCWATVFKDGVVVEVKAKKDANAADSFLVRRKLEAPE